MNQIEELEQQIILLNQKQNNTQVARSEGESLLQAENKRMQNVNGELKRELQIQEAALKMSHNQNEQLVEEIKLLK